ncbi:MAG: hypothetical protein ACXVAV_11410 [Ktedonobacteraceae bacterium]
MNRRTKIERRYFRPAPQKTLYAHFPSDPATHLSGQSLTIARFNTLGLVILTLAAMLPLLPAYLSFLHTVCFKVACPVGQLTPQAVQALKLAGLSIDIFIAYTLVLTILALMMCWIVAAVIVWHKSDDWMALLVAVMLVLMGTSYVTHLLLQQPSPWQMLALCLDILTFGVFFLVFCLFPSGRFVPSWLRWMPVGWIIWGLITIAIHEVPGFYSSHLIGFIAGLIVIVSAQIYRYFRVSTMVERQQTKWVVWGASVAIVSVVGVSLPEVSFPSLMQRSWLYCLLDAPALTLALILGSISIGMAVLRAHLWDIDVLMNRTLVYGLLTANLAFLYLGLVMALQFFLQRFFSHTNDVALVASTLAIAALFQPLRGRIQRGIDRRFYRRKYDAAHILDAFSARLRLRDDVELSTLTRDLLAVVEETMQPAHVSLWLLSPESTEQIARPQSGVDES